MSTTDSSAPVRPHMQPWQIADIIVLPCIVIAACAIGSQLATDTAPPPAGLAAWLDTLMALFLPRQAAATGATALAILALTIHGQLRREYPDSIWPLALAALILLNPVILGLTANADALMLLAALATLWHAVTGLGSLPFPRSGLHTGLALGFVILSAPHALPFFAPLIAGLIFVMPRRLLRANTLGYAVTLLAPAAMAVITAFYLGALAGWPLMTAWLDMGGWAAQAPMDEGTALWQARLGGTFLPALGTGLIWACLLAPSALVAAGFRRRWAAGRTCLYGLGAIIFAMALTALLRLPLPPLVFFAALVLTALPAARLHRPVYTLAGLALAWICAMPAAWLYG